MKKKKLSLPTRNSHLGGGILESRTPDGLKKFSKNKKTKGIVIGSIVGIILLIGGITLYKTFALYEEKKEFNVIKGQVPDFSTLTVSYVVEGVTSSTVPSKSDGYLQTGITCSGVKNYSWDNTNWKVSYSVSDLTNKNVNCSVTFNKISFSNYLINLSNTDTSIVKETHESTEQTGSNATIDYRYIGANPNNYVCLEPSGTCTDDNLYRIIGVIPTQSTENGSYENRVKLIKATNYLTNTAWAAKGDGGVASNNWTVSTLNTITLNTTYWNSISSYQKYIEDAKWYLGGISHTEFKTSLEQYKAERDTTVYSGRSTSTVSKIGLMYPSDYGYATSGGSTTNRDSCLTSSMLTWNESSISDCKSNNWLYDSSFGYWTISHNSRASHYCWYVNTSGRVYYGECASTTFSVLPTFYLKSAVRYGSGIGTKANPYRINV